MDQTQNLPQSLTSGPTITTPQKNRFNSKKNLLLASLLIILLAALFAGIYFAFKLTKRNTSPGTGSASVFTNPSEEFQGVIEKIDDNSLTVSYEKPTGGQDSQNSNNRFLFNVIVNDKTTIVSERDMAPFQDSATSAAETAAAYSLSDLLPGQVVTIVTEGDLKKITSNTITAKSIIVSPGLTIFLGKIENIDGNKLFVKSGPPSISEEKTYQIIVTDETDILSSRNINNSTDEADKKLSLEDLSSGASILINTVGDINKVNETQAIKIELVSNL